MIIFDECEDNYLYRIKARNARIGVFKKKFGGFIIPRTKFDYTYLFVEYHWDVSEKIGTVKPLEKLEEVPFKILYQNNQIEDKRLLNWLKQKELVL